MAQRSNRVRKARGLNSNISEVRYTQMIMEPEKALNKRVITSPPRRQLNNGDHSGHHIGWILYPTQLSL